MILYPLGHLTFKGRQVMNKRKRLILNALIRKDFVGSALDKLSESEIDQLYDDVRSQGSKRDVVYENGTYPYDVWEYKGKFFALDAEYNGVIVGPFSSVDEASVSLN